MSRGYKYFLAILFMSALLLPAVQKSFKIVPLKNLELVKVPVEMDFPSISFNSFLENTFQDSVNTWFNFTTGFKPLLVRLRNQIDDSCFDLTHGSIVLGKNDCLFINENLQADLGWQIDPGLLSLCQHCWKKKKDQTH